MSATGADPIDLRVLHRELSGTPFCGRVHHFEEIDSTNTRALREGTAGAPHGSVYVADAQTGGRGRGAHTWSSPPATGLYMSVLLRPSVTPQDALCFSLAAGLAAQVAVEHLAGFVPDIRWPNDLLSRSASEPRKLGGILTEMHAEVTRVRFLVIGIGINVHQREFPPELSRSATSLAIEAPRVVLSRQALLVSLLCALSEQTDTLTGSDAMSARAVLLRRLEARSTWMRGKAVFVHEEQPFQGVTEGLDQYGFLRVRTAAGEVRLVRSGGVRAVEKAYAAGS